MRESFCVSDKLHKQVELELGQLGAMFGTYARVIEKCRIENPNPIEIAALGSMLHSFYTGIENIFKRIAIEYDCGVPQGELWHKTLLNSMGTPNSGRSAVITPDLLPVLREFLNFRHVFRQAYSCELKWEKMKHLVLNANDVLAKLEKAILVFLPANTARQ
jgi:hypothetical protein